MKGWIEKLKDEIIYKKIYSAVNPTNALNLIAEIERLEKRFEKECKIVNELCRQREQLQVVREAAEKVDWEGIILLVDGYPVEVVKLRELQRALAAKGKDEKSQ